MVGILTTAAVDRRTGILRITGEPGGDFHLWRGKVVAVNSPGAPGVPELLARPGRNLPGAMELRALRVTAAFDAAFAVAAGWIGDCFWAMTDVDPPQAVIDPAFGVEPVVLEAETTRRLRGVAPGRIAPHRHHLARTELGDTVLRAAEAGQRREILLRVDGRHTCREIAFLLGRSLYAVTVEISRWSVDGVVTVTAPPGGVFAGPPHLPRRRRDASGINELYPPESTMRATERKR
ncbi:hypothetical protein [Nocardia sp. NPDC048505]|uniref:hypothetical protein n=1 Tax=unclassified Nocardia TaxID=2637762 RepID=UPI0033FB63C1